MRLEYADEPRDDLDDIRESLERYSSETARHTIDEIHERARQIALFPYSGRLMPGHERLHVRELVEGRYLISYVVGIETIVILGISPAMMDR